MIGGSQQLRRFRIAHRAGATVEAAAALAGMSVGEAQGWAKDDAKNPPPAEAYRPLGQAFCATCGHDVCGCTDLAWLGVLA